MSKEKASMNKQQFLKGKKILITSFSYADFGGAELNAVELADQLVEFGAIPYFFSYDVDGPLAKYISKRFNTDIITDEVNILAESEDGLGYIQLNILDYDYIWVGANMIPISILKQINKAKKLPKFIFIHMSQLVAFPLDAPLLPDFEKKIASRILSISPKATEDCIYRIFGKEKIPLAMWPNPTPREFSRLKKRSGELKKVAVVSSSYPTDEIMGIQKSLEIKGIEIDYVGKFNNNVKVVDANFYDEYDLIIGIGKNVKYSLVSGVPIYLYGRFGGCGYLSGSNYSLNEEHNFSGRGFTKKDAETIAKEVTDGYKDAIHFHEINRNRFIQEYSIDITSEKLFRELEKEPTKKVVFNEEYINLLVSIQINLMQDMKRYSRLKYMDSKVKELENNARHNVNELDKVYGSKSWKITKPLRFFVSIIKRIIRP